MYQFILRRKKNNKKLWISSPCKINVLEFYLENDPLKKDFDLDCIFNYS